MHKYAKPRVFYIFPYPLSWLQKQNTYQFDKLSLSFRINRNDMTRTCNLYIPNVAIYQIDIHSVNV